MTDEDYIRKAADLALLWGYDAHRDCGWLISPEGNFQAPSYDDRAWQVLLDALAAQLVRQLGRKAFVFYPCQNWSLSDAEEVQVYKRRSEHSEYYDQVSFVSGEDRSLVTIKAVVDSKVLE